MATKFFDELTVPINPRFREAYSALPESADGQMIFRFELYRKQVDFGSASFDQLWMSPNSVYGQRNHRGVNGDAMADYFWASCLQEDDCATQSDLQEIFLLAKLLPFVRSTGARRVFADARTSRLRPSELKDLNSLLEAGSQIEVDYLKFHSLTGNFLGPPDYDPAARSEYFNLAKELFADSVGHLLFDPREALQSLRAQWNERMQKIGRHSGNTLKKQVLDVFSYESRAAMHRCYSHVWLHLMREWVQRREMGVASHNFHKLWHLEMMDAAEQSSLPNRHLFHGAVFGLHPACSSFVQTKSGQGLIAEFIMTTPGSADFDAAFQRLLNGIVVAIYYFAQRREDQASLRRQPLLMSGTDLDQFEHASSRRGRRRTKRK